MMVHLAIQATAAILEAGLAAIVATQESLYKAKVVTLAIQACQGKAQAATAVIAVKTGNLDTQVTAVKMDNLVLAGILD